MTNSIHRVGLVEKQIPTVMVGGSVKDNARCMYVGVALSKSVSATLAVPLLGMNGVDDEVYYTTLIWRREPLNVLF